MALAVGYTKAQLKAKCEKLGLKPREDYKKDSKDSFAYALRDYYLEQKYGGDIPKNLELMLTLEQPMVPTRMNDCKEELQKEMWESPNWYIEEKMDGCFEYSTPVLLEDGTTLPIGYIVENKLDVRVMSYNKTKNILEPKRVVNWFNNGVKSSDKWCSFGTATGEKYLCTKNHKFYNKGTYLPINNFQKGDGGFKAPCLVNKDFIQAFVGTLLGDAHIDVDTRKKNKSYRLNVRHTVKHRDYILLKKFLLNTKNDLKDRVSGYGSEMYYLNKSGKDIELLYKNFYKDGKINITYDLIKNLPPMSLAFWFMDDGSHSSSLSNGRCQLATHRYKESEVDIMVKAFNDRGFTCSKAWDSRVRSTDGFYIIFNDVGGRYLMQTIAPYVIKVMDYKLLPEYRDIPKYIYSKTNTGLLVDNKNICIKKNVDYVGVAYDIEVEDNHNYFANNYLVHNCRQLPMFIGGEFYSYSRNLSDIDLLPIEYSNNIYHECDFSKLQHDFILDSEVICLNPNISTVIGRRGVVTETQLQAVTALLSMNSEDSIRIQKENNAPLKFCTFDCIYYDGEWLLDKPLIERRKYLKMALAELQSIGFKAELPRSNQSNKRAFYKSIVDEGGEGGILKDIYAPYYPTSSRAHRKWVKAKRSMSESISERGGGDTIDAFITGYEDSSKDKAFADYVGGFQLSCYLVDEDGNRKLHHIATISSMTLELRKEITEWDENGVPRLKFEFYNKVCEIDGQAVSARARRLKHAVLVRFRPDKTPDQCEISETFLNSMIL